MARIPFTLRIEAEERAALENLSKIEGRPVNQLLNEAIKSFDSGHAKSWLFLAMAQHLLGRIEEARRTLDKAVPWREWPDRFEYFVLRREAEELINGGKH